MLDLTTIGRERACGRLEALEAVMDAYRDEDGAGVKLLALTRYGKSAAPRGEERKTRAEPAPPVGAADRHSRTKTLPDRPDGGKIHGY